MEPQMVDYYNEMPAVINVIEKMNEELSDSQAENDTLKKTICILKYQLSKNKKNKKYKIKYDEMSKFANEHLIEDSRYIIVCDKCLKIYDCEYECEYMSNHEADYGQNDIDEMIEKYDKYQNTKYSIDKEPICSHCWYKNIMIPLLHYENSMKSLVIYNMKN